MSTPTSITAETSNGFKVLLSDPTVCRIVAGGYDTFRSIVEQYQRDSVTEENADRSGPRLLAVKEILDIFLAFKTVGDKLPKE